MLKTIGLALLFSFSLEGCSNGSGGANANDPVTSNTNKNSDSKVYSCREDAKKCPDGSYVSRAGANCEFSACPP